MDCSAQKWSFPGVDGLFAYNDPAGELLRSYKFGGQKALADLWARRFGLQLFRPGPLVPVPSLRRRAWQRGWDPVLHLVRALGRETGLPVWRVLVRRPSQVQKTLGRAARRTNAQEAYAVSTSKSKLLAGLPLVWLVDDVVTTGATVEACADALARAGVQEVRVLCLGLH
jgi:ComF family protein